MKKIQVVALALAALLLGVLPAAGGKPKGSSKVNIVVMREEGGKPVQNAAVVLHPVDKKGRQHSGGVELKTDPEGKCYYSGVPYGRLRVQVIAPGFQTYGEDYEIEQPVHEIVIKLKPPKDQLTIYK